ncbi:hypothetical protein N7539_006851 [Penicillium diatomitis]|uniref:Uncharacterized protein n=1 Tax=Penicillium diatomitis TaxID=2819901 RepID=A0A9W9X2N8_9EURO|nr:uncharacterized protein N7539_006851 [Penicillium diatomitis]KAJ5480957.1 hypothetical protein N7539_006851 [Penicillium diatomitis]
MSNGSSVTDHIPLSNVLSALGTLIGYIGTEVATADPIDRLLWPRRAFQNFSMQNAWKVALFMPLGGPLHKTALETMDTFVKHGLFQGELCGHMLGTAFFPDTYMTYQLYQDGLMKREASVRNGLWVRVMDQISSHALKPSVNMQEAEIKNAEASYTRTITRRQVVTVSYLQLSVIEHQHISRQGLKDLVVESDVGPVSWKIVLAIVTTELTAIGVALAVVLIWRSAFMIMWLIPLMLKLLCAMFTLSREDIMIPRPMANSCASAPPSKQGDGLENPENISVTIPISRVLVKNKQGLQVISGPENLVMQFFRHYGHPRRCRWKEIIEIATIAALGLNFPCGLVCSLIWMPVSLQCVWTFYALYVTCVMYIARYSHGAWWATAEELLADNFVRAEEMPGEPGIILKTGDGNGIMAKFTRTTHDSYACARDHAMHLVGASSKSTPTKPAAASERKISGTTLSENLRPEELISGTPLSEKTSCEA